MNEHARDYKDAENACYGGRRNVNFPTTVIMETRVHGIIENQITDNDTTTTSDGRKIIISSAMTIIRC